MSTTLSAILTAPARTILMCLSQPVDSRLLSQWWSSSISGKHICLNCRGEMIFKNFETSPGEVEYSFICRRPFCNSLSWHGCCLCQGRWSQCFCNFLLSRNLHPLLSLHQHLPWNINWAYLQYIFYLNPNIGTAASTGLGKANLRPSVVDVDHRRRSVGVQDVLNMLFVLYASCLAPLLVQTHKRLRTP